MRRAKPAGLKTGLSLALAAAVLITGVALPATLIKQIDELAANLKITPLGAR